MLIATDENPGGGVPAYLKVPTPPAVIALSLPFERSFKRGRGETYLLIEVTRH